MQNSGATRHRVLRDFKATGKRELCKDNLSRRPIGCGGGGVEGGGGVGGGDSVARQRRKNRYNATLMCVSHVLKRGLAALGCAKLFIKAS